MKNNKGHILLKAVIALITILIILSLCFLAYLYFQEINLAKVEPKNIIATLEQLEEYTNHSNTHNEQETNIVKPIIDEQEPAINNEQQIKNIADHYYYSQLDNNGKIIYAGLYSNKENLKSGNYKIDFGTEFNELLNQTDGEAKLSIAFQSAWDAFSYDNADVFYIDVDKVLLITESRTSWGKTTYNVVICAGEQNYLIDTFKNEEEVNIAEDYIENISNKIVSALQGYSDYDKIKYLHNWIIDNMEYDITLEKKDTRNIYGALKNKVIVCEGYARLFKYILDKMQIPCVIVTGEATNSTGKTELHAWNYVMLEKKWYAVDVTWDDPLIENGGTLNNENRYQYFLKGANEFFKDHKENGKFVENSIEFKFPTLSQWGRSFL